MEEESLIATKGKESAKRFTVKGAPLLSEGQTMVSLAEAQQLWIHLKVYADGGENNLHFHPVEDHAFFVLAGEADFRNEEGEVARVGRYEGIMIPRGVVYAFRSSGGENLVMLRMGAGNSDNGERRGSATTDPEALPTAMRMRLGSDGQPQPGNTPENLSGAIPGRPIPNTFFAVDTAEGS
jgi:mannose-6-phosphate isomerase-like protein (cupin superfamily)